MIKVTSKVPSEVKTIVKAIQKKDGDLEKWLNAYSKRPYNTTYYGDRLIIEPLHCSYGSIGYSIQYRGYDIKVDNEMKEISVEEVQ